MESSFPELLAVWLLDQNLNLWCSTWPSPSSIQSGTSTSFKPPCNQKLFLSRSLAKLSLFTYGKDLQLVNGDFPHWNSTSLLVVAQKSLHKTFHENCIIKYAVIKILLWFFHENILSWPTNIQDGHSIQISVIVVIITKLFTHNHSIQHLVLGYIRSSHLRIGNWLYIFYRQTLHNFFHSIPFSFCGTLDPPLNWPRVTRPILFL